MGRLVQIGVLRAKSDIDEEFYLGLPKSLAPWDAANHVAQFLSAWLEATLNQRNFSLDSLNYVINELMENAIKYAADGRIELAVCVANDALLVSLSHPLSTERAKIYQELASLVFEGDPDVLFAEIIERNAVSDGQEQTGAGLGLISLRQNYAAGLAFEFQFQGITDSALVQTITQVSLPWI
jgi:hypothetical protein